ncbi:UDP-glucosyltransferase [Holotrichia oblita]|uniref:UDP-glucosyltransferase n=1 Tax=Holotrichia oblita TaxID=644536 RepID=A0ACB9T5H3_HOLOL|nr:UDP-glucosyltransferase [Holotrichia oblita]
MGGNVKVKNFLQATRDAILRVFSKLKEKVLWKFEDDLPGKPKNVEIRKWLPQQDILGIRKKAKEMSILLNDKQVKQIDKAAYWIEYVIRHKGAPHLRVAAHELTWAHSHWSIGNALVRGLAAKGHEVTFVTPYEEKETVKNVKSVFLSEVYRIGEEMRSDINLFEIFHMPSFLIIPFLGHMSLLAAEVTFADPAMEAILNSEETYDAVVIESFFADSLQGIGYKLKAPTILLTAFGPGILTNYLSANPDIYSHMPHPFSGYTQNMNFCERVNNYLIAMLQSLFNKLYFLPQQNKILHKFIPDAPNLYELNANISLQLFNSDPAINGPMPLLPNLVEVGGIHIQPPKKLPGDLQKLLDETHPNIKLFITHGGLLSTTESLYHGVPVVGISVFGDQALNMRNAENRGYGISIPYKEFTEEKFANALDRMLKDSSYAKIAKEISVLLKDKTVSPLDKAVDSVEYVIRHKGAPHLKSVAHQLNCHFYIGESIVKALAEKGHHVTYVSPYKEKKAVENIKSVHLSELEKSITAMRSEMNVFDIFNLPPILFTFFVGNMNIGIAEKTMQDQAMQELLKSDQKFDVVILEWMINDYLQGIAHHFKAPSISATTFCPGIFTNYVSGNPSIYSHMPHVFSGYGQKMDFWERTGNFMFATIQNLYNKLYFIPQQERILHKYFPDAPSIYELNANISVHLFNSHPVINGPLPMLPNVIEIGGIHIQPPKKLPDDLQKYLDDSKDGLIYFSLGGNVKSKDLPQSHREAILRVLSKLKQRVLWKFEEDLAEKPANVEVRKWLPQQAILAHPNVKLFITHGGLLSTTESLNYGVPIVGISVFGDQAVNMKSAEARGFGISLPYKEFTEEKFASALDRILNDSSYMESAKKISALLKDQFDTPAERVVHWVEYVIRHNGTSHLRSISHDLY